MDPVANIQTDHHPQWIATGKEQGGEGIIGNVKRAGENGIPAVEKPQSSDDLTQESKELVEKRARAVRDGGIM